MTLDELQVKREELLKAIGIARVQFSDRSLQYVTDKERELALIDAEIARVQAKTRGSSITRQIRVSTEKGF